MLVIYFLGTLDTGLLYPLLIIPIGMIGASNAFNMLAGYNGLEAGMGIVILSTLGLIAYNTGNTVAVVIAVTFKKNKRQSIRRRGCGCGAVVPGDNRIMHALFFLWLLGVRDLWIHLLTFLDRIDRICH